MSGSVRSLMNKLAADGTFSRNDLQKSLEAAFDGKGVTKTEKKDLETTFAKLQGEVRMGKGVADAFEQVMGELHYSRRDKVFVPKLDRSEIRSIIDMQVDQARAGSSYSDAGGGEGPSAGSYDPPSSYGSSSGGE